MDENEKVIERASDMLRERVKLKISIIGIGNAGNQLLNEALSREDIRVFAINTSDKDLGDEVVKRKIKSFVLGHEAKGAGKRRDVAQRLFQESGVSLTTTCPEFMNMCDWSDIIIVTGSTAGGTGSGVAPAMIRYLQAVYKNKIIIYIGILPRISDSIAANMNSIECLAEIQQCKVPYMLADLEYYKGVPNQTAYTAIQKYIMNCIDIMGGKYLNQSKYGMIDENDMRVILSEPGYLSLYDLQGVTQSQLEKTTLQGMMTNLIKSSPAAERTRNGVIKQMGVILNMPEEMTDISMSSDYTELSKYIGDPISVFENFATVQGATAQMILILSGQSSPIARIHSMNERAALMNDKAETDYDLSEMTKQFDNNRKGHIDLTGSTAELDEDARRAAALQFFKS